MHINDLKQKVTALETEVKRLRAARQMAHDALELALHRLPHKPAFDRVAQRIEAALVEIRNS